MYTDADMDRQYRENALATEKPALVRCMSLITHELNERIKAWARSHGKTADAVAGGLLMKSASHLDQWEAEETVQQLKERFGPEWLNILQNASNKGI